MNIQLAISEGIKVLKGASKMTKLSSIPSIGGKTAELAKRTGFYGSIGGIINQKKVEEDTTEEEKPTEPTVNPVVDMVGNAIKNFKPKGHFVQGVSVQNVRKGS